VGIRSEGMFFDATVRLGIRKGMMYKVLGQPVVGSVIPILWITKEIMSRGP
jgi:hypothetical protein